MTFRSILLIDANSIASRAWFTDPYSYFSMTTRLLQGWLGLPEPPTHMAVCFDHAISKRKEMWPAYKAGRPQDNGRKKFISCLFTAYSLVGVLAINVPGAEADDVIASLAQDLAPKLDQVLVFSGDSDLLHLVSDKVTVIGFHKSERKVFSSEEDVINALGVRPDQVIDYKMLAGDTSDNIPGVSGIGPKGARQILSTVNHVEDISCFDGFSSSRLAKVMDAAYTGKLRLWRDLITPMQLQLDYFLGDFAVPSFAKISEVVSAMKESESEWRYRNED